MSRPRTRQGLIDYCMRALGHPVIEINVDDDQVSDRVDETLQFFSEYHFDGVEKVYMKYIVTQDDINNGYISMAYDSNTPGRFISGTGVSGHAEDQLTVTESGATDTYVNIEDLITSITEIWHFSTGTINMFDVRYQYALNDLYSFGSIDLVQYTTTQSYLSLLQQMLSPAKSIRFSRRNNKLYIDMNWSRDTKVGDYMVIEAYRVMDPRVYPELYDDMLVKRHLIASLKRQWGANLSKFQNIELPGGIKFNGAELWQQANEEIKQIEDTVQSKFEEPPRMIMG